MLLQDGPATFQAMFASIRAAHINMETYIIEDDAVGNSSPALIEKQVQGVQVNLIYDNVGVINSPKAYFKRLSDSGIKVLEFNPVNLLSTKERRGVSPPFFL